MGYLRPWLIGGGAWFLCSLAVLLESSRQSGAVYQEQLWLLFSLLWLEFPFAGLFQYFRRGWYRRMPSLLLVAVAPPLTLYFLIS